MDANYCVDLFKHLSKYSRENAFSTLIDSLGPGEMGIMLSLIEQQLVVDESSTNSIAVDNTDHNGKVAKYSEDEPSAAELRKSKRKQKSEKSVKYSEHEQGAAELWKSKRKKKSVKYSEDDQGATELRKSKRKKCEDSIKPEESFLDYREVTVGHRSVKCDIAPESLNIKPRRLGRPKSPMTGLRVFQCPCCVRKYDQICKLKGHMIGKHKHSDKLREVEQKVRINVKSTDNNLCRICGKEFKFQWMLRSHIATDHENLRPFTCDVCAKTFKNMDSLKKHLLVHQDSAYSCDFCAKKFRRGDHLLNHMRRAHTGERPFKCDKCDWSGPDSASFVHHKKRHD